MASWKPGDYGAKTSLDAAAFLLGAAAGGLVDASLNAFGFAEPFVIAPLAGAGLLGLKKAVWDAPREQRSSRTADDDRFRMLNTEAELVERLGDPERGRCIRETLDMARERGLDGRQAEKLVRELCR